MTDSKEQIASEAPCRNHLSGFAEVCVGVCGDSTVPGQPHPCEHALTVWRSDAQEILRALLAGEGPVPSGEGNNTTAAAVPFDPPAEKLWLWRNGDHFLAYRHLYPCYPDGGDPLTLGEPTGYALLRPSAAPADGPHKGDKP